MIFLKKCSKYSTDGFEDKVTKKMSLINRSIEKKGLKMYLVNIKNRTQKNMSSLTSKL